jgi:succinyl-diaminopimelate desuccinylase
MHQTFPVRQRRCVDGYGHRGRIIGEDAVVDVESLLRRAEELIAVESVAERPAALHEALDRTLASVAPGRTVERFESGGKPSALVYAGARRQFRAILNGHLDVVPGAPTQFTPRRDGDRLYGRGAHDMKVAALVMAAVFADVADELPVALQLVTDEEVGGQNGTAHQIAQGVSADFVVIGEQSALRVVTESRGLLHARVRASGRTAHAAYPWLGDNALLALMAGVSAVTDRYPVPPEEQWTATVNVARIETPNGAYNQVPDAATAWLDIRFPAGDPDLDGRSPAELAQHLGALTGLPVTVEALSPPHRVDPGRREVGLLQAAARGVGYSGDLLRKHGAGDGRHYAAAGIDAVAFGPAGDGQHSAVEWVDMRSVGPYHDALVAFLRSLTP